MKDTKKILNNVIIATLRINLKWDKEKIERINKLKEIIPRIEINFIGTQFPYSGVEVLMFVIIFFVKSLNHR